MMFRMFPREGGEQAKEWESPRLDASSYCEVERVVGVTGGARRAGANRSLPPGRRSLPGLPGGWGVRGLWGPARPCPLQPGRLHLPRQQRAGQTQEGKGGSTTADRMLSLDEIVGITDTRF